VIAEPRDNSRKLLIEKVSAAIEWGGGRVISVPGVSPIRFEVTGPSDLPVQISHLVRNITCLGEAERVSPFAHTEIIKETVNGIEYERKVHSPGIAKVREFEAWV
jgi:hypothetical protein